MAKHEKAVSPGPKRTSDGSLADILRKGNLSVPDPGPVTPPTAQISTGKQPNSSANASSSDSSGSGGPGK